MCLSSWSDYQDKCSLVCFYTMASYADSFCAYDFVVTAAVGRSAFLPPPKMIFSMITIGDSNANDPMIDMAMVNT